MTVIEAYRLDNDAVRMKKWLVQMKQSGVKLDESAHTKMEEWGRFLKTQ